jgi:Ca2+-binding EF-hand superfamily protein
MPRAVDKMSDIFEEYRKTNWPEELPSRVLKEILTATDENKDGKISLQEMEHFLEHIGASEKMTRADLVELLTELGAKDDMVDIQVIKDKFRDKRGMH